MKKILSIVSIMINAVYLAVLNMDLYTDRAMMPDGKRREWQRSPIDRLYMADRPGLLYLQLFLMAVSVLTGLLILFGVKKGIVKKVWIVSTAASTVMFIILMIVTGNTHAQYA